MSKILQKNIYDLSFFVIGTFIYSVAVTVFLSANHISPGGFTGLASIVNFLTEIPTGVMLFAFNIPVLIIGYIKMGGAFILKTSLVTVILSMGLNIAERYLKPFRTDGILAALFGGIFMGLGMSLILLRGATTGGIDIVAKIINRKYRHLSVGRIILMSDGIVIVLTAIVYKNIESALYSVVAMYAASKVIDILLYGADKGKIIYIVTSCPDAICKGINETLRRGVTSISAVGGYTGESRKMLMTTVRNHEAAAVHDIVRSHDPRAFIVVSDAGEIVGEGFKKA